MARKDTTYDAFEELIQRRIPVQIASGRIQTVHSNRATVYINRSSAAQNCILAEHVSAQPGDICILMRPAQTQQWVVIAAHGSRETGGTTNESADDPEVFPPTNVRVNNPRIPGCITVAWDTPVASTHLFEVQVTTNPSVEGTSILTTRGSYAIINASSTRYVRVRAISSQALLSTWSEWLSASPASLAESGIHTVTFDYRSPSQILIASLAAGAVADELELVIDTPFNGSVTIRVGELGAVDRLMASNENDPYEAGTYWKSPNYIYPGDQEVYLYLTKTSASEGAGRAILKTH